MISNIWKHPKTSIVGLLVGISTIAGTLAGQGVTLGHAGGGTITALVSGVAAALLGLLARDPGPVPAPPNTAGTPSSTVKLGCWALIALLLQVTLLSGCSGTSVAQNIVNWTPALQSAVASVDATAAILAPADAAIFTTATAGFDAASNTLETEAKAYLASPNTTILEQLQAAVVVFQQQVNTALLDAAKITNSASQTKAMTDINAVATVVNAILALVLTVSTSAQVAAMEAQVHITIAQVRPYLNDEQDARILAAHYGQSQAWGRAQFELAYSTGARTGF